MLALGAGEHTVLAAFSHYGVELGTDLEVRRFDRLPALPEVLFEVIEF